MLRRMADNGWITSRAGAGAGRRPRRVHEITAAGREALRDWLCAPVSEPPPRWRPVGKTSPQKKQDRMRTL